MFYCSKVLLNIKSNLANQRTVFRSGDKATFTLKRHASWKELSKRTKSDRGLIIMKNLMNLWYLLQVVKENISWNVFAEPCKSSTLQWWGKSSLYCTYQRCKVLEYMQLITVLKYLFRYFVVVLHLYSCSVTVTQYILHGTQLLCSSLFMLQKMCYRQLQDTERTISCAFCPHSPKLVNRVNLSECELLIK